MKIYLNNIGVIKESEIVLDGITVMTGFNKSGKTTVGKVVYSLVSAVSNLSLRAQTDKCTFIRDNVEERLSQVVPVRIYRTDENLNMSNHLSVKLSGLSKKISEFEPSNGDIKGLLLEIIDYYQNLSESSDEQIIGMYKGEMGKVYGERIVFRKNQDLFKPEINELKKYLEILDSDLDGLDYADRRIISSLQIEFYNQITPLRYKDRVGEIKLFDDDEQIFDVHISKNKAASDTHMFKPTTRFTELSAIMIDEAQDLDNVLYNFRRRTVGRYSTFDIDSKTEFYQQISAESHKTLLARQIMPIESTIKSILSEQKAKDILEKIEDVFDDYIVYDNGRLVCSTNRLDVGNLAAGTKIFAMLRQLVINGKLDDKSILILDEPDSHLHPQWQLVLADVLFLINKELGTRILLTTHSIDFLYAMDVAHKERNIPFKVFDTLVQDDEYSVQYVDATDNIKQVYSKLGTPLQTTRKKEVNIENL